MEFCSRIMQYAWWSHGGNELSTGEKSGTSGTQLKTNVQTQLTSSLSKRSLAIHNMQTAADKYAVKAHKNLWTETNHSGNIVMTLAENRNFNERFAQRLGECAIWTKPILEDLHYNHPIGVQPVREAIARHVNQYVFKMGKFPVEANQIVTGNGVLAVLENLIYAVADADDGILVIAPFWHGFVPIITGRMGVNIIVVKTDPSTYWWPSKNALDEALREANRSGIKCTALMVCNPSNPLGKVFSEQQMLSTIRWATSRGFHFISDEIYAATVFDDTVPFVSAWDVASEHLSPQQQHLVHVLWGPSKDFGVPGLRMGAILTKNPQVLNVEAGASVFTMTSTPMQRAIAEILSDSTFVADFMRKTITHLKQSCDSFTSELRRHGINYIAPSAGLFVVIDLRSLLPSRPTFDDEFDLYKKLCDAGVVITPGNDCHTPEPGLFRVCPFGLPETCYSLLSGRIADLHADLTS